MDKRALSHRLQQLRRIHTWQLVIILFFGLLVSATLLRLNNLNMVELRQAVISADEKLDSEATKAALVDLQRYVSSHMNTSLSPGVYLEKAYARDRDAAIASASSTSNPQSAAYQAASIECRARFQGGTESFRSDYVQCVIERVKALSPGADASSITLPRANQYRYNFVSPLLSFDLAGFAVLVCVFITGVIVVRILAVIVLRMLLKRRFNQV